MSGKLSGGTIASFSQPGPSSDSGIFLRLTEKSNDLIIPQYVMKRQSIMDGDIAFFLKTPQGYKIQIYSKQK